ncbi:MAG: CRTAC1 family protein, partial [Planctomycetota bacterium]
MGSICADIDNDGDQDIFVVNDVAGNFLYRNDGTGHFDEIALFAGLAYNGQGDETGSMGVDCGDYDNDGLADFCMTAYQGEMPVLYHNNGDGTFEDRTLVANAGDGCFPYVNWGVGFVDLDNDGDRDLFIANGHLMDNIDLFDHSTAYKVRNVVLENDGTGRFRNISESCGDGLAPVESSRGAAFGDLDNDGDLDIVVLNSRAKPTIIRNDQSTGNHWLQVRLRGVRSNRDGIGATIRVTAGGKTLYDDVHSGRGYQSHWGLWVHFGVGKADHIDRLEVRWPSGTIDVLTNVAVDRRL